MGELPPPWERQLWHETLADLVTETLESLSGQWWERSMTVEEWDAMWGPAWELIGGWWVEGWLKLAPDARDDPGRAERQRLYDSMPTSEWTWAPLEEGGGLRVVPPHGEDA